MSNHKAWVKETSHKSPSMIYLRKAVASVVKQTDTISLQVLSEGDILDTFEPINQKTIAQAAKWALEIDDEICIEFFSHDATHVSAWISVLFQGDNGEDPQGIIFDHSERVRLPK